jgi:hypothetical protein
MVHPARMAKAINSHHSRKFSIIYLFPCPTIPKSLSLPKKLLVYLRLPSQGGPSSASRGGIKPPSAVSAPLRSTSYPEGIPAGRGAEASVIRHPSSISDITEKDNANLAIAVQRVVTAFAPLYNAKLIEPKEFIRLVYRFVAETIPEKIGDFAPVNVRGAVRGGVEPPSDASAT